jgi:hypothetical protein
MITGSLFFKVEFLEDKEAGAWAQTSPIKVIVSRR